MTQAFKHNQLQGQALAVLLMDMVRTWAEPDTECTLWTVTRVIAQRYGLDNEGRQKLYHRVNTQLRSLEAAGLVRTEKKWVAEKQVFTKHIYPSC